MAQQRNLLDREAFSCAICLDVLKDPVTIPCGHNYCMNCIETHWDGEGEKRIPSCPQCRKTFTPRPVLVKNTMLADLAEKLKKTGLQTAPAILYHLRPEDVDCDVCTGRKLKAFKSCMQCLASYCEKHLQPHYDSAPLKKHKLVEPFKNLQENICCRHDEVMKMFCRTDQQSICYLCSVDEHKGHDTVSAAAERTEKQREVQGRLQQILQRVQDREEDVKLLHQDLEAIGLSADKTVEHSEKIFTELEHLIQKRRSDVKQQVRSQQETEVSRVKENLEELEQEITELKRKAAELEQLSHTEDHIHFLHNYRSLSDLSESTHSSRINIRPLSYFEDVTAAVSELGDKLQDTLRQVWTNVTQKGPGPEPKTRDSLKKNPPEPKTRDSLKGAPPEPMTEVTQKGTGPEPETRVSLKGTPPEPKTEVTQKGTGPEPMTRVSSLPKTQMKTKVGFLQYSSSLQPSQRPTFDQSSQPQMSTRPENLQYSYLMLNQSLQPEPKTRAEFLQYSRELTLDPNTAQRQLKLSEENRKVTYVKQQQRYPDHPERFTERFQVLSRESLTGRCYWEVKRKGGVYVAVTYKSISRAGRDVECIFGRNEKSWVLECDEGAYTFWHNNNEIPLAGPPSSKIGVYLDHIAGVLSFYNVSKTMTLLHRVQTTFTEPLYAGFRLYHSFLVGPVSAELCNPK